MAAVPSRGRASFVEAPARAPQAAATEGLYERHSTKILSYCLHQLGSREEAEDAVQTTFMNAFRALGRGVVPEAESAWLFKIAENVCLSRRRSSWRRGRIESPSDFDVIEEIVPGPSRQRDELIGIEDALASMPEQQRRAILLREWQGLSYREVAHELGVSQAAVETLIFRARRSLAQGLEQPDLVKKPKRKSFRRALHMIDLGTIAAAAKTLLAGSAAVKATAAAIAVTAAATTTAVSVTPKVEGRSPKAAPPPAARAAQTAPAAPRRATAPPPSIVSAEPALLRLAAPAGAATAKPAAPALSARRARPAGRRPARVVPVSAPATVELPPPVAEPVQPVEQSPAVEQPVAGEHEPAPAQPDEARQRAEEVPASPAVEPKRTTRGQGNGHGQEPASVPEVPPALVQPPVAAPPEEQAEARKEPAHAKKSKRDLTVVPTVDPVLPVVIVPAPAPAPLAEPAAVPPPTPAPAAPTAEPADAGKVKGHGRGK